MKAIILCAGLGTRMRPLTDAIPKCLLPVGGKPLIHHTLEALAVAGVDEVAINLHHLPGAIVRELRRGYRFGVRITYSFERELLGTAGAIKRLQWWLDEEPFFVVYGDEWTTLDFGKLWQEHRSRAAPATAVVHWVPDGTGRDLVRLQDNLDYILHLAPEGLHATNSSGWALSGVFIFHRWAFDDVPIGIPCDLEEYVVHPHLQRGGSILAYRVDRDLTVDIGKPAGYERAKRLAAGL